MVAGISLKDFYEGMLTISTAIRVNPDTYIHTNIHMYMYMYMYMYM